MAAAVQSSGVEVVGRDTTHRLPDEEYGKPIGAPRHDEGAVGVVPAEFKNEPVIGNEYDFKGHHHRSEHDDEENVASRERDAGKGIPGHE